MSRNNTKRLRIGERVRVLGGSGVRSGTEAVVSKPFDWREEEGSYKPVPAGWVYLRTLNGSPFTMPRNRIVSTDPRTRTMSNPPSFVLVEKDSGLVVYTKRASGMGTEAINKCVLAGRNKASKTGKTYFVFLDIGGLKVGSKVNVPMAYAMGITEEIHPPDNFRGPGMSGRIGEFRPRSSTGVTMRGPGYTASSRETTKLCPHCGASYIGTPQMHKFECPPQGGGQGMYKENPRRVRRNVFLFNNPPSGPADDVAARELELYIDNDSQLYHSQFIPIVKNLMLKRRKGVYNRELAVKLFMYLMDSGAKKYVKEFGTGGKIDTMFNRNTRMQAARAFRDSFETEAELGNYDRLIGPVSNPRPRRKGEKIFICHCGRMISADDADASGAIECECGRWYNQFGQALKDPSKWEENPRRVRKNVFLFNNPSHVCDDDCRSFGCRSWLGRETRPPVRRAAPRPRRDNSIEAAARSVGLLVTTWAPGDGVTRYRFFVAKPGERYADYHQGGAIYTANGRGEAMTFLKSYGIGRSRTNPSRKAQQFISRKIGILRREGRPAAQSAAIAYSMARKRGYRVNPSPVDPPGLAELDARMNDLMRRMDAMKKAKTDGSPEYMLLLKEAQAVSRERIKLLGLHGKVLPNPLLQTVFAANPPISETWNKLSQRQRLELLEIVGVFSGVQTLKSWSSLPESTKELLKRGWFDTTSSGGTTRRRRAVAVNPLTRKEAGGILTRARYDINLGSTFRPGHTRSERAGQAHARAQVVRAYGPIGAGRAAMKIADRAQKLAGTVISNPGVRFPKPGTKLTIAEALAFAEKLGNKELVRQCHAAMKLQKAANRGAKCVIWKVFPMGSSNKIDNVVALTHYGDSPETMYRPPKGSKKGNHMYRHTWGEKGGKPSVPLLASPDGKMLMMPLEGKKIASDWLRH